MDIDALMKSRQSEFDYLSSGECRHCKPHRDKFRYRQKQLSPTTICQKYKFRNFALPHPLPLTGMAIEYDTDATNWVVAKQLFVRSLIEVVEPLR